MSDDNDLIRRGDAIEALKAANLPFGYGQAVHAITNAPAVQVTVKPLDLSYVQKHAFLAGVVAARNVPPTHPCSGPLLWLDYDPGDNPALSRIRSAMTIATAPDAVKVAALVEAAEARGAMPEGYCFCSTNRIGDDSKMHEPECRDLRAALAAMKECPK